DLESKAGTFLNEAVPTTEEALQGARDIIAERISEDAEARQAIRNLFAREALLTSSVLKSKIAEAANYRDYFDFSEPLRQCPSHRMLAIRRGEREGFLSMDISVDAGKAVTRLKKLFVR